MGAHLRILTVEDQAVEAMALTEILLSLGHEVCGHAYSGGGAILLAERIKPDLMIADIQLGGGLDGIAAAAEVKNKFGISTIFVTGFGDDQTRQRAEEVGHVGFLSKPYAPEALSKALISAIRVIRPQEDN